MSTNLICRNCGSPNDISFLVKRINELEAENEKLKNTNRPCPVCSNEIEFGHY